MGKETVASQLEQTAAPPQTTLAEKIDALKKSSRVFRTIYARFEPNATPEAKKLSILLEGFFLSEYSTDNAYFLRALSQLISTPNNANLQQRMRYFYQTYLSTNSKFQINISWSLRNIMQAHFGDTVDATTAPAMDLNTFVGHLSSVVADMGISLSDAYNRFKNMMDLGESANGQGKKDRISARKTNKENIDITKENAKSRIASWHVYDRYQAGKNAAAQKKKSNNRTFDQYIYKLARVNGQDDLVQQRFRRIDEDTLDAWALSYLGGPENAYRPFE